MIGFSITDNEIAPLRAHLNDIEQEIAEVVSLVFFEMYYKGLKCGKNLFWFTGWLFNRFGIAFKK